MGNSIYPNNTYSSYVHSIIGRYEADGPVNICGDFNVDVSSSRHCDLRRTQLADLLDTHSLYIVSQSSIHQGPEYTFFRDSCPSTLDYIVASSFITSTALTCFTHLHHPLNLSDHLPLSISVDLLFLSTILSVSPPQHVYLAHAVESDRISLYEQAIALVIQPLSNIKDQSIENLNDKTCFVCWVLLSTAQSYLLLRKHTKRRETSSIALSSRIYAEAASRHGVPGMTYLTKKGANQRVKQCGNKLHASQIWDNIQCRDKMFKKMDHR